DRDDWSSAEFAGKTGADATSITNHRHVIVIPDFFCLGATDYEIVQRVINDFGDKVCLFACRIAAERIAHRAGLIDQKNDAGGVCAGDLGRIHRAYSIKDWRDSKVRRMPR